MQLAAARERMRMTVCWSAFLTTELPRSRSGAAAAANGMLGALCTSRVGCVVGFVGVRNAAALSAFAS